MPDIATDAQIGATVVEEIKRCLWRLQFVGADTVCQSAITTGRMSDGTEVEVIIRGIKHEG